MLTLIAFLGALGILIVFHEFGHYLAARNQVLGLVWRLHQKIDSEKYPEVHSLLHLRRP